MYCLPVYSGSVMATWREDSYTADSDRHMTEGSGNEVFLLYRGSIMVT